MTEFEKWDKEFRSQNLSVFNGNYYGLLWLKVRAICRSKQLRQFVEENKINLTSKKISNQNVELYNILIERDDSMDILDKFLQCISNEWYNEMGVDIEQLKEDLYKIQHYAWGGNQNNSLDKYLISRYVKVISNYNELLYRQNEIGINVWNYVQNSWYNNWTSFVIESLFKRNHKVISAVGEIKSVDFFIEDYPLDLKVTFFPSQFMEQKLKSIFGKSSISWLKGKCKELGISYDKKASVSQQLYTLTEKLNELQDTDTLKDFNDARRQVIEDARRNPSELMKWLYENQGEMRFGAENRIYLILVDIEDLSQSWKMKRAFSLIEPKIRRYIADFSSSSLKRVEFEYKKNRYTALSDILFIVK
ncbi:MAG: hypothetical protein K2O49_06085 [Muribaculaceae bacterium]|nr:hypothetical protein [Muribaculaceae bacterium]